MKKYYQAALTLTAVFSLIALLIYRHEYNKLRFILEFFNSFGTPIHKSNYSCGESELVSEQFLLPEASWQRINDNLFVYSAYYDNDREVRAIGVGEDIKNIQYSCHVIADNVIIPIEGKFSYKVVEIIEVDSNKNIADKLFTYWLKCTFKKILRNAIIGVQFRPETEKGLNMVPISHVHTVKNHRYNNVGDVICVAPPTETLLNHTDMISFLAFHSYLGWNHFIIYDFGTSHVLNSGLKKIAKIWDEKLSFTYTTIPWNFPYRGLPQESIKKIIETDCMFRTFNNSTMTVTLSWNEFLNMRYQSNVTNVLTELTSTNKGLVIDRFQLSTLIFCIEPNEDELLNSAPTIVKTFHRLSKVNKKPRYIYKLTNILKPSMNEQNVGDLIYINHYQQCNVNDKREIVGGEVLKFSEYISSSKIFQYFKIGSLFTH